MYAISTVILLLTLLFCTGLVSSTHSKKATVSEYDSKKGLREQYVNFVNGTFAYLQSDAYSNSTSCQSETRLLLSMAEQGDEEARNFLKATGMPTCRVHENSKYFIGSITNCLKSYSWNGLHTLSGKYCVVDTTYVNGSNTRQDYSQHPWYLLTTDDSGPSFGFCVPSLCESHDVQLAVNQSVSHQSSLESAYVIDCTEKSNILHDPLAIAAILLISLILLLILCGTAYDVYLHSKNQLSQVNLDTGDHNENSTREETRKTEYSLLEECLLSFSLKKNASSLFYVNSTTGRKDIGVLHGVRVISMYQIILYHSILFYFADLNLRNNEPQVILFQKSVLQIFISGRLATDTFFFMSGLLVSYVNLGSNGTKKKLHVIKYIVHRIIRLSPMLIAITLSAAGLTKYLVTDDNFTLPQRTDWCRRDWWMSNTYLQNFIIPNNGCFSNTWFVAVDFQFYILALPILLLFSRSVKSAFLLIGVYFVIDLACNFVLVKNTFSFMQSSMLLKADTVDKFFENIYIKPYCRMVPYLVGLCTGYVLLNTQKLRIKKVYTTCLWILSSVNILLLVFVVAEFSDYIPMGNGIILEIVILLWTLSILWVIVACTYGYGGFLKDLLSWNVFVVLSRVTYSAYLMNTMALTTLLTNTAPSPGFATVQIFYNFFRDVIITYLVAIVMALVVELPFIALEKAFLSRRK